MALLLHGTYVDQQGSLNMAAADLSGVGKPSSEYEKYVVWCGAVAQLGSGHCQATTLPVYVGVGIPSDMQST